MPGVDLDEKKSEDAADIFLKIGLDQRTANNVIANSKVTANLCGVIQEVFFFSFHAIFVILFG